MKIRFTKHHVVKQGDGNGPVYEVGQTYTIADETYARKYIARGWAVDVTNEPAEKPEPPKAEEVKPKPPQKPQGFVKR